MGRVDTLRNDSLHVAPNLRLETDAQSAAHPRRYTHRP